MLDDATTFEVEKIIDARRQGDGWEYLVKWKFFPDSSNTWESESQFDSKSQILDFWSEHSKEDYMSHESIDYNSKTTMDVESGKDLFETKQKRDNHQLSNIAWAKRINGELVFGVRIRGSIREFTLSELYKISPSRVISYLESRLMLVPQA